MKNEQQIRLNYKLTQERKKKLVDKLVNAIAEQEKCQSNNPDTDELIRYLHRQIHEIDTKLVILDWVLDARITGIGSIM